MNEKEEKVMDIISKVEMISEDSLIIETEMNLEELDEILFNLSHEGHLFQPKPAYWKTMHNSPRYVVK